MVGTGTGKEGSASRRGVGWEKEKRLEMILSQGVTPCVTERITLVEL